MLWVKGCVYEAVSQAGTRGQRVSKGRLTYKVYVNRMQINCYALKNYRVNYSYLNVLYTVRGVRARGVRAKNVLAGSNILQYVKLTLIHFR